MSAYAVFKQLGLKNIKLKINSIGNLESRKLYSNALKEYFSKYIEKIEGNYMSVIGLPIDKVYKILKENEIV